MLTAQQMYLKDVLTEPYLSAQARSRGTASALLCCSETLKLYSGAYPQHQRTQSATVADLSVLVQISYVEGCTALELPQYVYMMEPCSVDGKIILKGI